MGAVHLGRVVGVGGFSRTVAIKRLHSFHAKNPEFVAMFLDEARLAARIRHPNVVPTLDVVEDGAEVFLVMEYVEGDSLSGLSRIQDRAGGRIPADIVSAVMSNVLHGLHAAHEAADERGQPLNLVHRDVSPQNVMVGADGVARVFDFGVAKAAGRLQTTREGTIKGKFAYMAPEQLEGSAAMDRRSDIYAAAIVLWEALCAKRLFEGDHEAIVLARAIKGGAAPPSSIVPELPPAVDAIVARGLSKAPNDRYPDARAMALALESAISPATPARVASWVNDLASDAIRERTAIVARIESSGACAPIQPARDAPLSPADARVVAAPPDVSSQVSTIAVSGAPRSRDKTRLLAIVAAIAAACIALAIVALNATSRTTPQLPAIASAPSVAAPVSSDIQSPPTPEAGTAALSAPTDAGNPAATPARSARVPTGAAATAASPKTAPGKAGCEVPYEVDSQGHKIWKKHCLQ
jgi:eukaryotic-like serine/threonine-protein kinase